MSWEPRRCRSHAPERLRGPSACTEHALAWEITEILGTSCSHRVTKPSVRSPFWISLLCLFHPLIPLASAILGMPADVLASCGLNWAGPSLGHLWKNHHGERRRGRRSSCQGRTWQNNLGRFFRDFASELILALQSPYGVYRLSYLRQSPELWTPGLRRRLHVLSCQATAWCIGAFRPQKQRDNPHVLRQARGTPLKPRPRPTPRSTRHSALSALAEVYAHAGSRSSSPEQARSTRPDGLQLRFPPPGEGYKRLGFLLAQVLALVTFSRTGSSLSDSARVHTVTS